MLLRYGQRTTGAETNKITIQQVIFQALQSNVGKQQSEIENKLSEIENKTSEIENKTSEMNA
jgi:hypothetical protein